MRLLLFGLRIGAAFHLRQARDEIRPHGKTESGIKVVAPGEPIIAQIGSRPEFTAFRIAKAISAAQFRIQHEEPPEAREAIAGSAAQERIITPGTGPRRYNDIAQLAIRHRRPGEDHASPRMRIGQFTRLVGHGNLLRGRRLRQGARRKAEQGQ